MMLRFGDRIYIDFKCSNKDIKMYNEGVLERLLDKEGDEIDIRICKKEIIESMQIIYNFKVIRIVDDDETNILNMQHNRYVDYSVRYGHHYLKKLYDVIFHFLYKHISIYLYK